MEILTLWLWPLLALILLPGLLVYFGLHVVERGIIFVDLALAQIAALGVCVAVALGAHPGHDALHGFTVVLFSAGPSTWIGRWQEEQAGMIRLADACEHRDGEGGLSKDAFLREIARTGPRPAQPLLEVPRRLVTAVKTLGDVVRELRDRT